jgi:hypothetical protein
MALPARAIALQECGKVRIATLHPATAVHYGRSVSAELIPLLARHS